MPNYLKPMLANQLSQEVIDAVYELIMVTIHDKKLPSSVDQGYVVDIDLSSFGLPWEKVFSSIAKLSAKSLKI